ncbi:MAG: hypothetical protein FVQ86_00790 [candidate division NC10 bacterium]|nr:hypothetical protein [candidate division NC10 bacterium]
MEITGQITRPAIPVKISTTSKITPARLHPAIGQCLHGSKKTGQHPAPVEGRDGNQVEEGENITMFLGCIMED